MNSSLSKDKHSNNFFLGICTLLGSFSATLTMKYILKNSKMTKDDKQQSVHDLIITRRTISTFEPELPKDWEYILKKAIEAAIMAPNHKRTEPWRFYVPNRETIVKICELNASIVAEGNGGAKAGEAKLKKWLLIPGWVVVTCKKQLKEQGTDNEANQDIDDRVVDMSDPKGRTREDYAAVCCAIQNLCLSLHSDGYGTKWTTGKVNFDKRFDDLVGIPMDEYVVGTIFFGKPTKKPYTRETKLSVDNVLKFE